MLSFVYKLGGNMKKIYEMTKEEVFESVRSSEKGLKTEQAEERLQAYGENVLKEKNKKSPIKILEITLSWSLLIGEKIELDKEKFRNTIRYKQNTGQE